MPTAVQEHSVDPQIIARFWAKVQKPSDSGCWLWTGSTVRGYGQVLLPRIHGRQPHLKAHRFAWLITNGPIADHLFVCHRCDIRCCVNPNHLFLGTQKDNLQDASRKGRLTVPRAYVLTLLDRLTIQASPERGVDLAQRYGVSRNCISQIRHGRFVGSGVNPVAGAR
jgi:hypothetical protein